MFSLSTAIRVPLYTSKGIHYAIADKIKGQEKLFQFILFSIRTVWYGHIHGQRKLGLGWIKMVPPLISTSLSTTHSNASYLWVLAEINLEYGLLLLMLIRLGCPLEGVVEHLVGGVQAAAAVVAADAIHAAATATTLPGVFGAVSI